MLHVRCSSYQQKISQKIWRKKNMSVSAWPSPTHSLCHFRCFCHFHCGARNKIELISFDWFTGSLEWWNKKSNASFRENQLQLKLSRNKKRKNKQWSQTWKQTNGPFIILQNPQSRLLNFFFLLFSKDEKWTNSHIQMIRSWKYIYLDNWFVFD